MIQVEVRVVSSVGSRLPQRAEVKLLRSGKLRLLQLRLHRRLRGRAEQEVILRRELDEGGRCGIVGSGHIEGQLQQRERSWCTYRPRALEVSPCVQGNVKQFMIHRVRIYQVRANTQVSSHAVKPRDLTPTGCITKLIAYPRHMRHYKRG